MNTESKDVSSTKQIREESVAKKSTARTFGPKLIDQLVGQAREQGLCFDGENELLAELTRKYGEAAVEGEVANRVGYEKHDRDFAGARLVHCLRQP